MARRSSTLIDPKLSRGLDLGTCTWRMYRPGRGIVFSEAAELVLTRAGGRLLASGNAARRFHGMEAGELRRVRPMRRGAVTDPARAAQLLRLLTEGEEDGEQVDGRFLLSAPSTRSDEDGGQLRLVALCAGARDARIVGSALAAALGEGIPVFSRDAVMVCDVGGGLTEVTLLQGGATAARSVAEVGGEDFKDRIRSLMKTRFKVEIDESTAADLIACTGSLLYEGEQPTIELMTRRADTARRILVAVPAADLRGALEKDLRRIVTTVTEALDHAPRALRTRALSSGLLLTGGGSLLPGLAPYLQRHTGIRVRGAKNPLDCVSLGLGRILEQAAG